MSNKPLKIGITGGIGAGKSIISRIFQLLGIPVYDADSRAKWLTANDPELRQAITGLLGEDAYEGPALNRTYVARLVFNAPEKLKQMNAHIHPRVASDFDGWVTDHPDAPYVLKEAALLFESGSYQTLDKVVLVAAPEAVRINRVLTRDRHRTREDVEKIIAQQWNEPEKMRLSDYVIRNDETQLVIPQVLALHEELLKGGLAEA